MKCQLKYFIIININTQTSKQNMNRIYLDEDRTIDAEISSDASMQADQISSKDRKITTKNLSTQFSLYIQQIKKDINRQLSSLTRDFYNQISIFLDQQIYAEKHKKNNVSDILRHWRPKLESFEEKLDDLKNHIPYVSNEKHKQKFIYSRKVKFSQAIQKFINKLQTETMNKNLSSKLNIQNQLNNAQSLYDRGRYEQAILKVKQLIKNKNYPQLNFLLGNCYKAIGYYQDAISQYDKAIKQNPMGCYYNNRGNCYLCLQDIVRAEHDYKKAIKEEPNNEVFLGNYGNVCLSLKKYEQAIISYTLALKAGPPNDFFYNNRAFAEIKLRRLDDAIQSYNQAISLSPNNHVYLKNRANLFMEKGNVIQALNDINDAIEIQPIKHEYYFLKGKWEYFSKKPNQALISFRKACQLEPNKKIYKDYYITIKNELSSR